MPKEILETGIIGDGGENKEGLQYVEGDLRVMSKGNLRLAAFKTMETNCNRGDGSL